MGSEEERTCPMCTEVMDMTDQQLKPCQCGYEICVWCWHNIVHMAEKDDTVGRCPACRSPYDKERILAMTISNERLTELNSQKKKKCKDIKPAKVNSSKQEKMQKKSKETWHAEIDSEKKNSQWAKIKPLEVRTHLSDVRVIQRNIVYIAGWPVSLAVEEICRKKEFLGQYGNIKRVDIIRTDVSKKHYPVTCVLFIAFSKEEEAIRCIQAVNGYTLDGRTLKACFGATGYCKAWLKNMRCVNPDCLFLHRVGPQEDMCNRHEVTTACVSKFEQWSEIGFNNSKKSSGKCLPPPVDNCSTSNHTASKPLAESTIHSPNGDVQSFNHNNDTRQSGDLPATSGARSAALGPSNCHSIAMTSVWSTAAKEANIAAQIQDISKSISKSAMDSSTNMGRVVDECSPYSALSTGLSGKELGVYHSAPPGCVSQNLKSGKPFPVHKDMVQDSGLLAKVKGDSRENISLTKKAIEEIKEDKVTSDILSLNLGLVEPHRLAKQSADANKKDNSLKGFANDIPCNTEVRFTSDIIEKSDTGREKSSLYSNGFYQRKKSDYMDTSGEKAVNINRSLLGLNAYDIKRSEVPKNSHTVLSSMVSKEFPLTSSVHPSGSSVSRRLVSPAPRYPPGFHPRHAADRDQPSMPVLNGPSAPYPFPGYSPHGNFSQELSRSNFVGSELHDPAKAGFNKEKLPQSTLGLNSCNWGPSLVHPAEMDERRQFELRLRKLTENSVISTDRGMKKFVDNFLIEETMQSNHSHREPSRLGNPVAAVSRAANTSYSGTSYSRTPLTDQQAPNLEQQSLRPFYDPEFEASNFSFFSYSQYKA